MARHDREHDVVFAVDDSPHGLVEVGRVDERRGRLQEHGDAGQVAGTDGDLVERVQQCGLGARGVARELDRAADHSGALGVRGVGDAVVVGRDEHGVDAARADGRADRAGDQRHARDGREVLAREALGAASGGHDRDDPRRGVQCATDRSPVWEHAAKLRAPTCRSVISE